MKINLPNQLKLGYNLVSSVMWLARWQFEWGKIIELLLSHVTIDGLKTPPSQAFQKRVLIFSIQGSYCFTFMGE